jgi:hypothetical protein
LGGFNYTAFANLQSFLDVKPEYSAQENRVYIRVQNPRAMAGNPGRGDDPSLA